ncbi:hypothetical protein J6590_067116 [Homalodisca vitripennis]|nr:hypothetical protein J6590_067116 [Homalodisca vitripennis]
MSMSGHSVACGTVIQSDTSCCKEETLSSSGPALTGEAGTELATTSSKEDKNLTRPITLGDTIIYHCNIRGSEKIIVP